MTGTQLDIGSLWRSAWARVAGLVVVAAATGLVLGLIGGWTVGATVGCAVFGVGAAWVRSVVHYRRVCAALSGLVREEEAGEAGARFQGLDGRTASLIEAVARRVGAGAAYRAEAEHLRATMSSRIEEATRRVHASLAALSLTDSLTGLANRRGFDEKLKDLVSSAQRDGREVALVAIDLDQFKQINDTCGHARGDDALRALGEVIRGCVRDRDLAGRIGGDEIMVALPGVNDVQASRVTQRIRERFAMHEHAAMGSKWPTLSCGLALRVADGADDADELRGMADRALYASKHAGRNRLTRYAPAMAATSKTA